MHEFDDFGETKLVRPTWARWITRLMLLICGLLMAVVMLSQPKVAAKVEQNAVGLSRYISDAKSQLLGNTEESAALAAEEENSGPLPAVSTLPQNRLPVNRAGIVSGD